MSVEIRWLATCMCKTCGSCIWIYTCTCKYMCFSLSLYIHIYIYIYICMYVCVCVCIHARIKMSSFCLECHASSLEPASSLFGLSQEEPWKHLPGHLAIRWSLLWLCCYRTVVCAMPHNRMFGCTSPSVPMIGILDYHHQSAQNFHFGLWFIRVHYFALPSPLVAAYTVLQTKLEKSNQL